LEDVFKYKVEQKTYKIGKYNIGGDPRSTPTAMVGTIFYFGQKHIFKDEQNGIIDKDYAEKLIKTQEELADKTGLIPCLDVILSYESSIKPILDFVVDTTDMPIFLDAPNHMLKMPTLEYVQQNGIQERIIYNSILPDARDEEYQRLSESKIKNFVFLAMEIARWTTQSRMEVIETFLKKAGGANLAGNNFFIDGCVIDFTTLGLAMSTMEEIKNRYGFPVGTAAQNAVDTWRNLKAKFGDIKRYASVVASTITLTAGADFLLYGPIQNANVIFPTTAFVKAAQSQLLFDEGKMAPPDHPVFKIG
jgi:tetrahydromethanopterin S-methyltransferase subunit H